MNQHFTRLVQHDPDTAGSGAQAARKLVEAGLKYLPRLDDEAFAGFLEFVTAARSASSDTKDRLFPRTQRPYPADTVALIDGI